MPAIVATLAGCALAWGGLVFAADAAALRLRWFVGFVAAGAIYVGLKRRAAKP